MHKSTSSENFSITCQEKQLVNRSGGRGKENFNKCVFELKMSILENLEDTEALYVIKVCPKNLARAKSALRGKNQKVDF